MSKNLYYVRCFTEGGYNYKDVSCADWECVKRLKRLARLLGESISYEKMQLDFE